MPAAIFLEQGLAMPRRERKRSQKKEVSVPKKKAASKKVEMKECPKCKEPYNPAEEQLLECPRCGVVGASSCCNMGGNRVPCGDCGG